MSPAIDLAVMTHAEKDALILSLLPLVGQLEAALARVAALEARVEELTRPPRTPDNSSTPPARGHKPNHSSGDRPPRGGRPGAARALAENPDHLVEARLDACPACQASFPVEAQTPQGVYDRICQCRKHPPQNGRLNIPQSGMAARLQARLQWGSARP